jgi:hypothetical protein
MMDVWLRGKEALWERDVKGKIGLWGNYPLVCNDGGGFFWGDGCVGFQEVL